ncbi:MAG: histidine kinase [Saprospiraceae bacterium]|nr:histidine kinase [Saprospiraceae bacterium]
MRRFFLIIGLWFALPGMAPPAAGQHAVLPGARYTIREGLAQQQVRAFWEDRSGYIWIGTNGGISRFDGRTLVPIRESCTAGKRIYSIREGYDGSIWYRSGESVYRFDGRTTSPLPASDTFWQTVPPRLWVLIPEQLPERLGKQYPQLRDLQKDRYQMFTDSAGAAVILDLAHRRCHRILKRCETSPLPADFPADGTSDPAFRYFTSQNTWYAWTGAGLERVAAVAPGTDSAVAYHPLAPPVFHFDATNHKAYWYRDGDRYRRVSAAGFNRVDKLFADNRGRLFIATDEGVAVLHTGGPERIELPQASYPWSVLPGSGPGEVWVASHLDGFLHLAPGREALGHVPLPASRSAAAEQQVFPGKLRGPDGTLLFGGYKGFYFLKNGKAALFPLGESIEALAWDARRGSFLAGGQNVYVVDRALRTVSATIPLPPALTAGDGITALDAASDGSLWAAGNGGIARLRPDGSQQKRYAEVAPAISLLPDARGLYWAGGCNGLFRYDARRDTFRRVLPKVIADAVNSLVLLPGDTLAVVTNQELLLLDIRMPDSVRLAGYWTLDNGYQLLEASENGSSFDGQYLWIPAGTGIQRLHIPVPGAPSAPSVRLRIDRIGQNACLLRDTFPTYPVEGGSVDIVLSLLHLEAGKYEVQYRLGTGAWQSAGQGLTVRVNDLAQGRNTIRFRVNIYGVEARYWPTAGCVVEADLPLWAVPAFWIGIGIVFSGLIAYLIQQYARRRKQEKLLLQANLSTTLAQLNPHLLFNLLATLQNSIFNRSKEEASAYLVRVTKFVREVLEFSIQPEASSPYRFPTIAVSRELVFLENYLHLMAMQQHPPFRYVVENSLQTPEEALVVPPLLVQPLVENAILHGIRPLSGREGEIRVRVTEDGDDLVFSVEDNGVGMDAIPAPPQLKTTKHRSRGGELLGERLRCLKDLGFRAARNTHPGAPHGTLATIRIKKMYAHHPG